MGKERLNLPVLVGLLWMASRSEGSDTVLLYPTIMMPRNITMGFGTFVKFSCELNITAGSASEVFWLLGGARIPNDPRRHSRLEVPAEGRYVSHLEVRGLQAVDAGRYTCDATARLNNLNLVRVIPDSVYLSVADYRAAHWGEPCDGQKGTETCVDANTGCFRERPPRTVTATGFSCQCIEGFPIHNPALRRCERGSHLGGPCIEDGQCRWFTQFSVCQRGVCQCADAYTTSRDGTECTLVIPEGHECSMDWECEPSGMECVERSCRHKVDFSPPQVFFRTQYKAVGVRRPGRRPGSALSRRPLPSSLPGSAPRAPRKTKEEAAAGARVHHTTNEVTFAYKSQLSGGSPALPGSDGQLIFVEMRTVQNTREARQRSALEAVKRPPCERADGNNPQRNSVAV